MTIHPWDVVFYLALQPEKQQDQISSHHLFCSYLPDLSLKEITVCVVQVWIHNIPEKQVQSRAQELDVKTQYFSASHFFKYVIVIVIFF